MTETNNNPDKMPTKAETEEQARKLNRLRKLAASASVFVAVTLAIVKIVAAVLTGSLAVLSSMVDSLADIAASGITLVSVRFSTKPPTKKHRYGHGKAEALSALAQSAFIGGSGFFILYDVIQKLITPVPIRAGKIGLWVMVFSLALTVALVFFQRYVIKATGSKAINADSANYMGDIVTNISIIIALIMVEYFGFLWFDPLAATLVAAYLLYNAEKVGREAVHILMDRELSGRVRQKIKKSVSGHSFVKGLHDLRTRDTGVGEFIEFHLELDGKLTLSEAHDKTHDIEEALLKVFPDAQIVIHQEPAGLEDLRLDDVIEQSS